ncbi:TPA: hypothetical protein DIC38_00310 [Candidatus Nomurabacteria bacterium]|nr:MAG: hypothetical protein O210_OD1C00001G0665 [Parcubacteria bacterium RAAC4_OD1_1]HCY26119.1 hypothetical protein [Candidatus Nomurabacteria bacterium]
MKIRKIFGAILIIVAILGVIFIVIYKESLEGNYLPWVDLLVLVVGAELLWPSKKKSEKEK